MSDFNSSLPVRTENAGDIQSKLSDGTTPGQFAKVDASGNQYFIGGAYGPVGAGTAAGNSDLAGLIYNSSPITLTTGQQAALQGDANGYLKVNVAAFSSSTGVADKTAFTYGTTIQQVIGGVFQDTSPALTAGTQGAARLTANRAFHANLRDSSGNELTSSLVGSLRPLDVQLSDSAGARYSSTNPVPVTISSVIPGAPVDNYNTSAALAAAASSNHDYTVTAAKTLYLKQIFASSSGKLKIEVQFETAAASGVFNSVFVGFNSTANPNINIAVPSDKTQVTGAKVRVIRTNLDKQAEDVYSTISGTEQ